MREIKFRAWDRENGVMGSVETLYLHTKQLTAEITTTEECFDCEWENCDLMQYTGLKDKNGKEIYEGDIVSNKNGVIAKVYFDTDTACYKTINPFTEILNLYDWLSDDFYVAGNIYENPELIGEYDGN